MPKFVVSGAQLMCTFGAAPGTLQVLPTNMVNVENAAPATIMDNKPMVNIMPFGVCSSMANPAVVAALGIPQPCVPMTAAPWTPGSTMNVTVKKLAVLTDSSMCNCSYGGVITITNPGAVKSKVT
jgi:hypothetical protein